jgi:hypothetical protein
VPRYFRRWIPPKHFKSSVADGQRFVDDEDIGINADCGRERQPSLHAGRVCLERLIDDIAQLTGIDDRFDLFLDLRAFHPEAEATHHDVLRPSVLGMESRAQLENRGDPTIDLEFARGSLESARNDLEKRRFPGTVPAENTYDFSALEFEIDTAQHTRSVYRGTPCTISRKVSIARE